MSQYLQDKALSMSMDLSDCQMILATASTQGIKMGVTNCKVNAMVKPQITGRQKTMEISSIKKGMNTGCYIFLILIEYLNYLWFLLFKIFLEPVWACVTP